MNCLLTDSCCCGIGLKTGSTILSSIQIIAGLLILVYEWYHEETVNVGVTTAAVIVVAISAFVFIAIMKVKLLQHLEYLQH